jgi:EmrB/QacA subfamily drug resistance transporter
LAAIHGAHALQGRDALTIDGAGAVEAHRPIVLAATILASSMAFIDGTIVTIALPAVQRTFAAEFDQLQWVVNIYTLMLGGLILVGGGLGDRVGHRRVFLAGIVVFTAASLGCAVAPNVGLLIAARAVQGFGAALLVPQSLAIISASFPKAVRGRAIGTWAAASAVTSALGPPLGGFLIDAVTWRAAFWINLPIAAAALLLTWRFVPESRDRSQTGGLDWAGGATAVLSLGALTYGLTALAERAPNYAAAAGTIFVGLAGLVAFVRLERRAANPIMPPGLFRLPMFLGVNVVTVFLYGCMSGVLFLLPFDLIGRRGVPAAEVGLTMMPLGLIIGLFSRLAGSAADRIGPRPFLVAGSLVVTVGCAVFALRLPNYWLGVLVPVLLLSFGMAAVVSPLTTAVMNAVPDTQSGAASGVSNAATRFASLVAVAVLGAIGSLVFLLHADAPGASFGALPPPTDPARPALESAFDVAYATAMWVAAAWGALAAVSAWFLVQTKPPPADARA